MVKRRNFDNFMAIPSEEEVKGCYRAFRKATPNVALAFEVWIVCAREKMGRYGEHSRLLNGPEVCDLLQFEGGYPEAELRDGMLVVVEKVHIVDDGVEGWVCYERLKSVDQGKASRILLADEL